MGFFKKPRESIFTSTSLEKLKAMTFNLVDREEKYKGINEVLLGDNFFLRSVLDTIPSLVFVKDRDSRFIYVNTRVAELYNLRKEDIEGRLDTEISTGEEFKSIHKNDVEVIDNKTEKFIAIESILDKSNRRRYFTTIKKPLINQDGSCTLLLGIATEITSLVEAQDEIKKSKERFEFAAFASEQGVWDWEDVRKEEEWWSPKYFEILGYEDNEFSPTYSFWKNNLVHPEDLPRLEKRLRVCFDDPNEKWRVEYRMKLKSGEYEWFKTTGDILRSETGFPVRMLGFTSNINNRVERDKTLEKIRRKYYFILESVLDALLVCDMEGKILFANKHVCKLTGYELEELIEKNITIMIPEDLKQTHSDALKAYVKGQGKGDVMGKTGRDVQIKLKNGSLLDINLAVTDIVLDEERLFIATIHEKPQGA